MAERITHLGMTEKDKSLVDLVTSLPNKILRYHNIDGLSQMVLHELGHDTAFGFDKATYLIDNPDFDHLVGVAGFCKNECAMHKNNIWDSPECFCSDMKEAHFNNDVRKLLNNSFTRKEINLNDAHDVKELGHQMGIENPQYFSWNMKHGNHGIFLYEPNDQICLWRHGLLKNMSALLSMCGIDRH
jgi:hypothetical protein